jgi:hypothetical protein
MATYGIIGLEKDDGNISLWGLNTTVGKVLMIFSDLSDLAEVMTYAERHGKGPDQKVTLLTYDAASPAQIKSEVEELRQTMGADKFKFDSLVTEGEKTFEDLLAEIKKQNATNGLGTRVEQLGKFLSAHW